MSTVRFTQGGNYDPDHSALIDVQPSSNAQNFQAYGNGQFQFYDPPTDYGTNAYVTDGVYVDFSDHTNDVVLGGGNRADVLIGGSGNDTINGGGGNDVIDCSQGGNDTVDGGSGKNTLTFAGSTAAISGTALNAGQFEVLIGNNVIRVNDIHALVGTAGDDYIGAFDAVQTIEGGAGADHVEFNYSPGTVSYEHSAQAVNVALGYDDDPAEGQYATVSGGDAEGDTVYNAIDIIGSAGDDVLSGNNDNNRLYGFGGSDTLSGGAGDDRLQVSSTFTSVDGGDGNDKLVIHGTNLVDPTAGTITGIEQIVVDAGASLLLANQTDAVGKIITQSDLTGFTDVAGTQGADIIHGGAGYDRLDGGTGDDRINGGAGDDRITGGAGGDHMIGGAGADTFVFQSLSEFGVGKDIDRILDFSGSGMSSSSAHSTAIAPIGDGDKIDLTQIANFTFIGTAKFDNDGTAELRIVAHDGGYLVKGDFDGDGVTDFKFQVDTSSPLTADDFVQSSSAAHPLARIAGHLDLHPSFAPMHGMEHAAIA